MTSYEATLSDKSLTQTASSEQTDADLLKLVECGDEAAFDELYRRYSVPIYNYLLRLIHEPTVAEDILQEVFVTLWQSADGFRGDAQVKTWLFRIAHNQAVSWLRKRRELLTHDGELLDRPVPAKTESQAIASWRAEQLRAALDQLSPDHRAVLELAFFHELPYAEIAEIMDCPVGTVKSRMSYARRYLSRWLKQFGVER
ncbi:MAG: RNA polymerase sigma factor [Anaerolineae bacterium]